MNNPVHIVSCHLCADEPQEACRHATALGLGGIEWFEHSVTPLTDGDGPERLTALARAHGLQSSYHAPWAGPWPLACKPVPEIEATLREMLSRAHRLGAHGMTLHFGRCREGEGCLDAVGRVARVLDSLAPLLEEYDLVVGVENAMPHGTPHEVPNTEDEMAVVMDACASPRVGLTFDTGHAHIMGMMDAMLGRWPARIVNVHLHDNDGIEDQHLPPGAGTIDWDALLAGLKGIDYAGPLTLEFPESAGKTPAFIDRLRACLA